MVDSSVETVANYCHIGVSILNTGQTTYQCRTAQRAMCVLRTDGVGCLSVYRDPRSRLWKTFMATNLVGVAHATRPDLPFSLP